jgi:hypothetical protein
MRKNTASQTIGAQLVSATDGSAVTSGTTTVYVTGDGGTQAAGAGTVAHEGNGYWSYAPTQAETNFDHVAFTFVNSSAIAVTVQVYTTYPQSGDSYARLGAPAGASIAADIAAIEEQTDDIGVAGAGLTAIPWNSAWDAEVQSEVADALAAYDPPTHAELTSALGSLNDLSAADVRSAVGLAAANLDTQLGTIGSNVDAILDDTGTSGVAVSATSVRTAVGLASANLDTQLGTIDTVVDGIKVKTDSLTFTVTGQVDANLQSINDVALTGDGSATPFTV